MPKIHVYRNISTETMAAHEWVKYEDHLSEMEHAEEMFVAVRNRCARVEAEIAEMDEHLPKANGPYPSLGERTKLLKDQMEYAAESSGQLGQEVKRLRAALTAAAMSLETIHEQAGHDEWMKRMYHVRRYANSRATKARKALD